MANQTKLCKRCKVTLPVDRFSLSKSELDGRQWACKDCQCKANRARRAKIKAQNVAAPVAPAPVSAAQAEDFELDITVVEPVAIPIPAPVATPLETAYQERAEVRRKREQKAQLDALVDENTALKDKIADLVKMQRPPDLIIYQKAAHERADAVACAIASDWHVEEPVIKDAVHGLNEFNLEIARSRSAHYFRNLLKLTNIQARDSKVVTIFIAALGDFFSGWIHEELIAGNLLAPGDAARYWKELFISGINFLLKESTYRIEIDCIPGNHGRMTRQVHFGDPVGTSLESFAYHALAGYFEGNPRVQINVSQHAMMYRKFFERFVVREIHGYEVKYGGGVGGLTIPLNKAIASWDVGVKADLTLLGHFHQLFNGPRFIANGSLIGYNNFAQAIKCQFEEAMQAFFLIHARNGGERSVFAPIWLDDARGATK